MAEGPQTRTWSPSTEVNCAKSIAAPDASRAQASPVRQRFAEGSASHMRYRFLFCPLSLAAGMCGIPPSTFAADESAPVVHVAASEATSRFIPLGVNKSVAINLPGDIKEILVGNT